MKDFKSLLKAKGFTVTSFAQAMNVARQTVSRWANGRIKPSPTVAMKMAKLLKVKGSVLIEIFYEVE